MLVVRVVISGVVAFDRVDNYMGIALEERGTTTTRVESDI